MIFWWIKPKSEAMGMALGQIEGGLITLAIYALYHWLHG